MNIHNQDWWNYLLANRENISQAVDRFHPDSTNAIDQFNKLVENHDSHGLERLMNAAWFAAPDARWIYAEPGFTEMCNLLDLTAGDYLPSQYN